MSVNDISVIKKLLEKFYDGTSTDNEDEILREYFSNTDEVASDLKADQILFSKLSALAEPQIPFDLDERLQAKIDEWEAKEKQEVRTRKSIKIPRIGAIIGVAASVLILISVGISLSRPSNHAILTNEPTPEEAYAQTQKALSIFADALDKSFQQMETIEETTTKVNRQIEQQINHLNQI